MLIKQLIKALEIAIKSKDKESINALRLVLAAIKDKEIALRTEGADTKISDSIIINILKNMIKQRNESIELYKVGNRQELADKETIARHQQNHLLEENNESVRAEWLE